MAKTARPTSIAAPQLRAPPTRPEPLLDAPRKRGYGSHRSTRYAADLADAG